MKPSEAAEILRNAGYIVRIIRLPNDSLDIAGVKPVAGSDDSQELVYDSSFSVTLINGTWHTRLSGPGQMSTIISIDTKLESCVQALIGFYQLETMTDIRLAEIQRLLWDVQREGYWCAITTKSTIEVILTDIPKKKYADDFMVAAFGKLNSGRKLVVTIENDCWTIDLLLDDAYSDKWKVQSSDPAEIKREIFEKLR